jgi:DNA-binding GntR family transcriptional regulator
MPRKPAARPPNDDDAEAAPDRGPTVEAIATDIAAAIVDKRLPPGTRLREEALGRVYAVSRTKIRAALLVLWRDKLIEMVPDKGAYVSKPSVEEARQLFAVRRVLEAEVVRLFMARARPADYRELEQHVRFERNALGSHATAATAPARERLLGDFHVLLAEACGNRVLAEMVRELVARSSLIAMLYQSSNDASCSTHEHADFLQVCRKGNVEAAVRHMTEHLDRVEATLRLDPTDVPAGRSTDLVKALLS